MRHRVWFCKPLDEQATANTISQDLTGQCRPVALRCLRQFKPSSFSQRKMTMSATSLSPTRRSLLAGAAAVSAFSLLSSTLQAASVDGAIRSFRVDVPEADLVDLRRRVLATRWPDKETVGDRSQGVQLAKLRPLVEY